MGTVVSVFLIQGDAVAAGCSDDAAQVAGRVGLG